MPSIITKELYSTEVTTSGGRTGNARSSDGILDIALTRPGAGGATNPEQLFAAGWSACFQSALNGIAKAEGVDASGSSVTARVTLGNESDCSYALKASLSASIPGLPLDAVEALVQKAHQKCPYSRATRGNIEVEVKAVAAA